MSHLRLLLVRHATTADTRRGAFPATTGREAVPGCAPLDAAGRAAAAALGPRLPRPDRVWTSAARRCVETAACAGLAVDEVVADLAECDFGAWAGRTPTEVAADDPTGLARWYADPDAAPHGGEGLPALRARAEAVLHRAAGLTGTTVAITSGGLVKAVLLEVLGLPAAGIWRLDAAPATLTELQPGAPGTWRVVRLGWTPTLAGWDDAATRVRAVGAEARG